ncbi:ABC transporter ATP-binding protein [Verrucomicrobiota bacterium sgz303538]
MIELRNVSKRFGNVTAVEEVNLSVEAGEFLTLLGPSGCGKTTLLRMISGFETPTSGQVFIDQQDVTHLPPYRRNVNQVFQSYALFPHLTVAENIAFGMKMQGKPKREIAEKVNAIAELMSLRGLESRRPHQLSGGQRQRIALARALVCEPKVLLLDEPLSALDSKLRHRMQLELKHLQRKIGITFVFVTHDQEEALTMSDRIAVVSNGRVEQIGSPSEVYHSPRSAFVADFIGQTNLLPARVVRSEDARVYVRLASEIDVWMENNANLLEGAEISVSIRPEKIHITKQEPVIEGSFEALITEEIFMGVTDQLSLRTSGGLELTAIVANESATQEALHEGDRVYCVLHPQDIVLVSTTVLSSQAVT